jgi:serine phosphatase RsbU (regulator of sigma subunit)
VPGVAERAPVARWVRAAATGARLHVAMIHDTSRASPPPSTAARSSLSTASSAGIAGLVTGLNRLERTDDIVRAVLDESVSLLGARTASLYVLSDAGDELVVAGSAGLPPGALDAFFARIPLTSSLPAAEVVRTGAPVAIGSDDERRARYPDLSRLEIDFDPTFVVVPLKDTEGVAFGSIGVGFPPAHPPDEETFRLLGDIAAHCALALDRARLADGAERAREHLGFLDALSATLSSSLHVDTALAQLAGLTVPRLADWCVVRLIVSPSNPRPSVGVAHVDPGETARLHRLAQRLPRDLAAVPELGEALRAGRPLIRGARAADMLGPLFDDPSDRAAMAAVGVERLAMFPLHARGRILGAIGFGNRAGRVFTRDEIELATAVAARAAVIVDNARLFHEQSVVARALQDSLLPGRLPEIPGIELGARYHAAGQGLDVGGDFYDAFQADENWWIVAVGDVCGHGVEAAATTGLVRHTIRSAAMDGVMPSAVLGRLNALLLRSAAERGELGDDLLPVTPRFCTVLVGAVQPTSNGVDIIVCSGGHPLPLVRRSVGRVDPVGVPGTLLGVMPEVSLTDSVVHLDPGEALACYTDGLTDRRSGRRTFGEEGIVKALLQGKGLHASALADLVESEALSFVDDEPVDDMAVLTLRAAPPAP